MKKKLLIVTGGAGFVGSNLISHFLKETNFKIKELYDISSGLKKFFL
jgi:UDP-glucose 4-epimerase